MQSKQFAAQSGVVINIQQGRAREYLDSHNVDAMMTFIAHKTAFDSPINLLIGEFLGADSMNAVLDAVKNAKSGDVILQQTPDDNLPDILFAVMPVWDTALSNEEKFLSRCYRNTLKIAKQQGYKRLMMPALGKGKSNFPHQRIVRLSLSAILEELAPPIADLTILCAEEAMYQAYNERLSG